MPVDLNLLNAKILTRSGLIEGGISIEQGKIVKVAKEPSLPRSSRRLDLGGLVVLPGLIDIHVHLRDMQRAYKEDFHSGTCAAAAGGFTTVLDMPNTQPITDSPRLLREKIVVARSKTVVNVGFYAAFPARLKEFEQMAQLGAVGFKAHLSEPWGKLNLQDDIVLQGAVAKASAVGRIVAIHAEDKLYLEKSMKKLKDFSKGTFTEYVAVHSEACELKAVKRILGLLRKHYRVHFCHISSPRSISLIRAAKKNGFKISCEATPHHLLLWEEAVRQLGNIAVGSPPIRRRQSATRLWRMLTHGLIDVVASDHAPHTLEEKTTDSIWQARLGFPGLETTLPSLLTQISRGELGLGDLARLLGQRPAEIFKLDSRGEIAVGKYADMVIVDLKRTYRVDPSKFHSKAKFSPFKGVEFKGCVVKTILAGKLVFDSGEVIAKPGSGKVLTAVGKGFNTSPYKKR